MKTIRLSQFKGVNNQSHAAKMPKGYLRECVNFRIDNSGMLQKRSDTQLVLAGVFTAVWSNNSRCFAVKEGDLVEINSDYSAVLLLGSVGFTDMSFAECNGAVYFVNTVVNGIIKDDSVISFGQQQVNYQPNLAAGTGILPAGTYLVAITTLDASGVESGTIEPTAITLTAAGSIELTDIFISDDPRVIEIAIYCSAQNGSELYRQFTIDNGIDVATISAVNSHAYALNTVGLSPAPLGDLIAYHYGHLYIAAQNFLFYSSALSYERWNPFNHYKYSSSITAILPCDSGLWIGTKKSGLYWISGKTPKHSIEVIGDMLQTKKHTANVLKNSEQRIEAEYVGQGAQSHGWAVTTNEGVFLLLDQGEFYNMSAKDINLPAFNACCGAIIKESDALLYLSIIRGVYPALNSI